jgi:hypothetical protein
VFLNGMCVRGVKVREGVPSVVVILATKMEPKEIKFDSGNFSSKLRTVTTTIVTCLRRSGWAVFIGVEGLKGSGTKMIAQFTLKT